MTLEISGINSCRLNIVGLPFSTEGENYKGYKMTQEDRDLSFLRSRSWASDGGVNRTA
jgi:hypothetical protein